MAWYVYVKYDVPVGITLAIIATETNYGRNKRMMKRGDLFGTGKTYKYIQAWDEFGRNMKRTYFKIDSLYKRKRILALKNNINQ